ncbi:hypothetical protein KAR91_40695 [Candidatus Pacearchaeota archaeon]|nr:hypothetical protein [Candidatus Pacearchaeota archaeon]
MTKKSELAAMAYLAKVKPKQYRITHNHSVNMCIDGSEMDVWIWRLIENFNNDNHKSGGLVNKRVIHKVEMFVEN